MDITITNFKAQGEINVPCSKSYAHRALIAAFISNKNANVEISSFSNDINTTLTCLSKLGARFEVKDNRVSFLENEAAPLFVELEVGESASTLRFLIPLAAYLCEQVTFVGSKNLFKRPLNPYLEYFNSHKIKYELKEESLCIYGNLPLDDLIVKENISSQFITGWLFLLAFANKGYAVKFEKEIGSFSYIDMTLEVLKFFGVRFIKHNGIIAHNFSLFNYLSYKVEKDWSQAAYFLSLGALNGFIKIKGMNLSSLQGDKKILEILMNMGAKIDYFDDILTLSSSVLKWTTIDLDDCIDLGPILMVVAAFAFGKTRITNYSRLEYKESSRAKNMMIELQKAGVDISLDEKEIVINGKAKYQGDYVFETYNDHRIAMALSIFSLVNEGCSIIKDVECINKSYPRFYDDLFALKK